MSLSAELWPYLLLILVGFLPNEVWRMLGLVLGRGLNEDSEIVLLARAVAIAIIAGVVAKLILFPSGDLASIPLSVRGGATLVGFCVFLLARRSMFAGMAAAEGALFAGGYYFTH
ncbi:MAG: AzlD domain-containing protein [Pseudolabrys sp.]